YGHRILNRLDRMGHVIEHAGEENHIEKADALWTDIHDVDVHVLHLRPQDFTGQQKALFVAPSRTVPTERVCGQHSRGTALLRLERIEAIPRTEIEERLAGQIVRKPEIFELTAQDLSCRVPRCGQAITQVERMEPARRIAALRDLVDTLLISSDLSMGEIRIVP